MEKDIASMSEKELEEARVYYERIEPYNGEWVATLLERLARELRGRTKEGKG